MSIVPVKYYCPCCGYDGLDVRPYKNAPNPPYNLSLVSPPYEEHWEDASYEVCDCCGFEFGNDDRGMSYNSSFEEYLRAWVARGSQWFTPEKKPEGWSLDNQLRAAGLKG